MIRYILFLVFTVLSGGACLGQNKNAWNVSSPNGNASISLFFGKNGGEQTLFYKVNYKGKPTILPSVLGINRKDGQFTTGLIFDMKTSPRKIDEKYTLKSGKCLSVHAKGNEQTFTFRNEQGEKLQLIVRAYNDGIAFCYKFPDHKSGLYKVTNEATTFALPLEGKAWIHPYDWNERLKPSYEQYCWNGLPVGSNSPYGAGWAYPMLFHINGHWAMITEAVLDGSYCATHVKSSPDGTYKVCFPEKEEPIIPDDPEPVSTLPWATPWRVVVLGESLADIVETNLVQHLNPPSVLADASWIHAGRSSWSWWSDGATSKDYQTQIEYVDFTACMGWEYVLIDAGWWNMEGGTMEDVMKQARSKNVGVWLWYHSGAGRSQDTISVLNLMAHPDARRKEMARIQTLGVKGIKVDFFDTDKQNVVKLYAEILADAAAHQLMVNFHGCTLPRGLERTWPNLMTAEAIKGAEGFGRQLSCDRAPEHNATVPFTRNVVGSMDYTPVTFSNKIRQGVEAFNVTTYAHQLALSVVFESGVQNFADNYRSYESLPEAPKEFLKRVPAAWDETRLVGGFPGDYVVIARRKGDVWYIGGINGKNEKRSIAFDLPFIPGGKRLELITDGNNRTDFGKQTATTGNRVVVELLPNGGFTGVIKL